MQDHLELNKKESRLKKLIKIQNKSLHKLFFAQKDGLKSAEQVFIKDNNLGQTSSIERILRPRESDLASSRHADSKFAS